MSGIAADDIIEAGCNIDPEGEDASNCIDGGIVSGIEDPWDIGVNLNKDSKVSETDDFVMGELRPIGMGEPEDIW